MPNITSAATYTKDTAGFGFLSYKDPKTGVAAEKVLLFAGSTVGTACSVVYTDDTGTDRTLEGGSVTTLPTSMTIKPMTKDLKIVVTGTPSFNVSSGN